MQLQCKHQHSLSHAKKVDTGEEWGIAWDDAIGIAMAMAMERERDRE